MLLTTLPLVLALLSSAGSPQLPPAEPASARLTPGERMEFSIDYKGMTLGRAELFVGKGTPSVIPAFLQTRTTGIAAIISVRQQLSSNIDRSTGLPRSTSLEAIEGSYRHTDHTFFDRASNKATVRRRGKSERNWQIDVPPDTLDFVALVFRLRQLPLEPGVRHAFPVLAGRNVSHVETEVVGRERVSTGIGELRAVKVRVPTNFGGEFQEKKPTFIWFSDDPRRIVVRISTEFGIGRATAELESYDAGASDSGSSGAAPLARPRASQ